jgi:hypothetical protein
MYATAWHNGGDAREPAGYGLKVTAADRDRYFDSSWTSVIVDLGDSSTAEIPLSQSFWRSSTELRSAEVGQWLLTAEVAPWAKGAPPGVVLTPVEANRFAARILVRRTLQTRH